MHKLDRASTNKPACLARYQHGTHTWDDVNGTDKLEIQACLREMQGTRCAYCEGALYGDAHIEHFRRKNQLHFPELTFAWSNLFWSCESMEHCGHYKDRPHGDPYNPADLVKPDVEDPDLYFYFHYSGEVRPRSGLNTIQLHKAKETIRVFRLDDGALNAVRRRALKRYSHSQPNILEELMKVDDEEIRQAFISDEIQTTANDPHCTVIRHFFEKII